MMASNAELIKIIKDVAAEQNYEMTGGDKNFDIYIDRWNAVAFAIKENSSGYLQVHQWEPINEEDYGQYGRAVYSLRSISDVIQFCSIMISSSAIRAKRKE